jgi:hypothetical protein
MAMPRIVIVGAGFAGYTPPGRCCAGPAAPQRSCIQLGLVPGPAVPLDTDAPELTRQTR